MTLICNDAPVQGSFLGPTWLWSNANTHCFHILPKIDMFIVRTLLEEPRLTKKQNSNEHIFEICNFSVIDLEMSQNVGRVNRSVC